MTSPHMIEEQVIAQLFTEARTHKAFLDKPVETATLQPTCANGCQGNAFGNQLRLETVGHSQPTHLPAVRQGFRNGNRREEMPARAAGGDQKPGHDGRRALRRALT